ncbi:cell wall metabolism sensor histidine kinase WalK [Brevibacillus humidisoli]|uniref:two-component system histidine kinase PnpS n=1 Tax=Brevibacillus humidisoli TaxID=2895522 RepID=UPI001E2B4435|nr:ATP-binding protein [Brevibacillus humidisoli]UFJ41533.1 cell wall metabolism sensor histidine kinase WalK [Brevibacillus humidisoli]
MTRFRLKLTLTLLGLISIILILMGVFFAKVLERSYMNTLTDLLRKEALLISEAIHAPEIFYNQDLLTQRVENFSESVEARVTVIDQFGSVIADTDSDPEQMENHADRPEFRGALSGNAEVSRRFSETLEYDMVYVAVPVLNDGEVIGAVRSAMSMEGVTNSIHQMWYSLVTGLLITLIVASLASARISKGITQPIEEITRVARNITQRQFQSRVKLKARDEIGQLAGAINFMASSLEQQMYEISENQQRLTGVLTNMTSGVMFVTENRRIMLVNPAIEAMLGTRQQDLVGRLHIEAGKNFGLSQFIDRCIDTGERVREEVHIYYPQERILDVNIAPYINSKGEHRGVVVVLHDITGIRRLEKMRSDFVANVSHELRTPITSIKGFTETLLDGAMHEEETARHFLQIISDESDRLYRLITDILDLSKIEQRRIALHLTTVNVQEIMEEIASLVQEQLVRKQLTLTLPSESNPFIQSDKDALRQILLNLVANAIAYTPEGGRIDLQIERKEHTVDLKVSDTGIGIPEKEISRIFERFYRIDKARSRDSGGTGLGLAIVKHLVENLQGHISVESKEGAGSTFTVTLPEQPLIEGAS